MSEEKEKRHHSYRECIESERKINSLESRLSQAEADVEFAKNHNADNVAALELDNASLRQRLSHLMDVAGKMAEYLEVYLDMLGHSTCDSACAEKAYRDEVVKTIAEWDGIKEGGK